MAAGITRRGFLKTGAALGMLCLPRVLLRAASLAGARPDDEVLVVLQLSGGNDGLNMVVPYEHDIYLRSRPVLAIRKGQALELSGAGAEGLGLHPQMSALRELYDDGKVAIIPGVGYPNPNRSHFRSMDIWHSARPELDVPVNGWLGRSLGARRDCLCATHIGDDALPLALAGEVNVPSLQNIDFLDFLATPEGVRMRELLRSVHARGRSGPAEPLRRLGVETIAHLERLVEVRKQAAPVDYPSTHVGERFRLAGQLIAGGMPGRIYYVSQDGYDTHARQGDLHGQLLGEMAAALSAFFRHMRAASLERRVTVFVFSEFGRRVAENGSLGTDHGAAAPVLVVSGRIEPGVRAPYPNLADLDEGDLRFGTDFRSVYATLLEEILHVSAAGILGTGFPKLSLFR